MRQYGLRRGDKIVAATGHDHRGRPTVAEIVQLNDADPVAGARRTEFASLTASYPERKITLETGRPAKGGPELTRRAIDLIAPIGRGQRCLLVAPPKAGKTRILQAIAASVAHNHPEVKIYALLVDERPEEVTDFIRNTPAEVIAQLEDLAAVGLREGDLARVIALRDAIASLRVDAGRLGLADLIAAIVDGIPPTWDRVELEGIAVVTVVTELLLGTS